MLLQLLPLLALTIASGESRLMCVGDGCTLISSEVDDVHNGLNGDHSLNPTGALHDYTSGNQPERLPGDVTPMSNGQTVDTANARAHLLTQHYAEHNRDNSHHKSIVRRRRHHTKRHITNRRHKRGRGTFKHRRSDCNDYPENNFNSREDRDLIKPNERSNDREPVRERKSSREKRTSTNDYVSSEEEYPERSDWRGLRRAQGVEKKERPRYDTNYAFYNRVYGHSGYVPKRTRRPYHGPWGHWRPRPIYIPYGERRNSQIITH